MRKVMLLHSAYPIGMVVTTAKKVLDAPEGSIGVIYEHYEFGNHYGISVIFSNGNYDGFSREDADNFDLFPVRMESPLQQYQFKDVGTLVNDFRKGFFASGFEKSPIR